MNKSKSKRTILVVDDQPKNLQLAAYVLKPHYELILVSSGEKAIKMANEKLPDLILLDIMMPGMSGYEVCEALKRDPLVAGIPVIFLTAKISEEDLIMAYDVGGVDYVTKPFRTKELLLRIGTQISLLDSLQRIKRYNDSLEIINENKDKLFSAIAHDLKGTSGQISGLIDVLLEKLNTALNDSELNTPLSMLRESSNRNFTLVNDLFAWSKSQFENASPALEKLSVVKLIDKIVDQQAYQIEKKKIQIVNTTQQENYIFSDTGTVEFVFRNLLSNAIKFVNPGGEIRFSFFNEDIYDVLEVKDNGMGMSASQLAAIVQGVIGKSEHGTSGEKGNGIGFKLCQDFMRKVGGFLKADSAQGKGTSMQIWIPHIGSSSSIPEREPAEN